MSGPWQRTWELFHRAGEFPTADRRRFVESECGGDVALRDEVLALLESNESAPPGFLEHGPTVFSGDATIGESVGPFRIRERIGAGGMGVVYLAEQEQPVRRRVAVKMLRAGLDTEEFLKRFDAERQALARMSHPGVARVYDAGATAEGRPYLAMECVDGRPITLHCDEERRGIGERLDLFVEVCNAVQHAHQRGVIHRDLKPSNILVTREDGRLRPKIIDFGIAKALGPPLSDGSLLTEVGRLIGTPEYMSPEQAALDGGDVDTRTDVYALGVVLYELLCGAQPFDPQSLRRAGPDEMRRILREDDPPRPSARLAALGPDAAGVADRRSTDTAVLLRRLHGDLDQITMKAIDKQRDRRYGSATELAADLRRHRAHEPVEARPPAAAYRLGKFVRRHRLGVTASAIVLVALLAGVGLGAWGLHRALAAEREASAEAETSSRIADFMVGLFEGNDPEQTRGEPLTAVNVLDSGVERIRDELSDQPELRGRLLRSMGRAYRTLGRYEQAVPLLEEAVALTTETRGATNATTIAVREELAIVYWYMNRFDLAEPLYREIREARREILGEEHPHTLKATHNYAVLLRNSGKSEQAVQMLEEVLERRTRILGEEDHDTLTTMNALANGVSDLGRMAEAETLYRRVLEIATRVYGEDHPIANGARNNLAVLYKNTDRRAEAEKLYRSNLEIQRRVLGDEHAETLRTLNNLAHLLFVDGRREEAEGLFREALATQERVLGDEHAETLRTMTNLAQLLWETGRSAESGPLVERIVALRRSVAERQPGDASNVYELASILLTAVPERQRDPALALRYARQAVAISARGNPYHLETLAVAYHDSGDVEQAGDTMREAIALLPDEETPFRDELEDQLAAWEAERD